MSYSPFVNYFWNFNGSTEDAISNTDFAYTSSPVYGDYRQYDLMNSRYNYRKALKFNNQTFSTDTPSAFFGYGGIMFYYYSPGVLGFTRHAVTKKSTPYIAPILAKAITTINNGIETISSGDFVISEVGFSDTENVIQLAICTTGSNPTHIVRSDPYPPGWHLISISVVNQDYVNPSYNYAFARIEIDANKAVDCLISPKISPTVNSFSINKVGFGYTLHRNSQPEAMLADVTMFTFDPDNPIVDNNFSLRCSRVGISRFITTDYFGFVSSRLSFLGIGTEQPSTITTNQITTKEGSIYLARSNGEILKGDRPIWDTSFDFQDTNSVSSLNVSDKSKAVWTPSGLQVTGVTVRI